METINYREFFKYLTDYSLMVTEVIPKKNDGRFLLFSLSRGIDSEIGRFTRSEIEYPELKKMWKKRCGKDQELFEYMVSIINDIRLENLQVLEDSMNQWVISLNEYLDISLPTVNYVQFKIEEAVTV